MWYIYGSDRPVRRPRLLHRSVFDLQSALNEHVFLDHRRPTDQSDTSNCVPLAIAEADTIYVSYSCKVWRLSERYQVSY